MTLSERIAQTARARAERRADAVDALLNGIALARNDHAIVRAADSYARATSPWVARAIARTLPPKEYGR